MKISALIIILLLILTSCSSNIKDSAKTHQIDNKDSTVAELNFLKQLIESEFLKHADSTIDVSQNNTLNIYDESTNKFAAIDAEELAEFSFDFFLPQLNKMLAKRNISLIVKTADNYEKTNDVFINGEKINLYTKAELGNGSFWHSAPRNFFRKLNSLLEKSNSDERFYLIYEGNDLSTLLLTEPQFGIIKDYYNNEPKEIPYLP